MRDRNNRANTYSLQFEETGDSSPDFEAEPNDLYANASSLNQDNALRGRLVGSEDDYLKFTVTGEPQLWRIQVAGEGLESLAYADAGGNEQQRRQAEEGRRIRLENLYLLPGEHLIRVHGTDGKYTVRAIPLGPPADAPVAIDQQAAFTVTAALDGEVGPPPIPVTEREPNDDQSTAMRIDLNSAQSGRLSEGDERDMVRFYLPAAAHVRFTVIPPRDAAVDTSLDDVLSRGNNGPGQPFVYEAILPPGDHFVTLSPNPRSDEPYVLRLERLNWFDQPLDLEPLNNWPDQAPVVTASDVFSLTGSLGPGDYQDFYRLAFPTEVDQIPFAIHAEGNVLGLDVFSGTERLDIVSAVGDNVYSGAFPTHLPVALRVQGNEPYTLTANLDQLPPLAPSAPLSLVMAAGPAPQVAAFWSTGQHVDLDSHTHQHRWPAGDSRARHLQRRCNLGARTGADHGHSRRR